MDPQEAINAIYSKNTKLLFKSFLILIEDLHNEHAINFKKLKKSFA